MEISAAQTAEGTAVKQKTVWQVYEEHLEALGQRLSELGKTQQRAKVAAIALAAGLAGPAPPAALASLLLAAVAFAFRRYAQSRRRGLDIARRSNFYTQGLERLRGAWTKLPDTGLDYARDEHLYQHDLQVVGERSLFTLLRTTRSEVGASRLADYLLDAVPLGESRSRQEAVHELQPQLALRESVAALGEYSFQRGEVQILERWMQFAPVPVSRWKPGVMLVLGVGLAAAGLLALTGLLPLWPALWIVLPLLGAQLLLLLPLRGLLRDRVDSAVLLADELTVLRDGLRLQQQQAFLAPKLKGLLAAVQGADASQRIGELQRLARGLEQCRKEWFYVPSWVTGAEVQILLAMEGWRARYGAALKGWVDAWSEFETLLALAGYAFEHPEHVFPEFVADTVAFAAEELGHPLLPGKSCVGNDVRLDAEQRFYVISGSNMAGKSTLLRTVGLNAVLAYAGAPVRARAARLSEMRLGASITTADSLLDGRSRFLAEGERLREMVRLAKDGPLLFLVDEIFSGTNSQDRRVAAEGLVNVLMQHGAVGALSTHDLALAAIAERGPMGGVNVHMESEDAEDPLHFDYRLKPGVAARSNALAILRMIGVLEDA